MEVIVARAAAFAPTPAGDALTVADWRIRVTDSVPRAAWPSVAETAPVREIRLAGGDGRFDTDDDAVLSFNRFAGLLRTTTPDDEALLAAKRRIDAAFFASADADAGDRKSTRLNSSHIQKSRMPSSA